MILLCKVKKIYKVMAKKKFFRWFKFIAWQTKQAEQAVVRTKSTKKRKLLRLRN
jgi:hypothetical protein